MNARTYVLDASAIIAFLEGSAGAKQVERLLRESSRQGDPLLISVANWGEAYYVLSARRGEEAARRSLGGLKRVPVHPVPLDEDQALYAAELKVRHKIPYVDCFAAALTVTRNATLVTSDRDFEKLEHRVQVMWLKN